MEKITFETEKIPFLKRCKKEIEIKIFVFLFFSLIPILSTGFNLTSMLVILFFLFITLFIIYDESKKFIYKIEFEKKSINIFGSSFDNNWNEKFEIKNVNIRIRVRVSKTGEVIGYRLIFKSRKKKISMNKLHTWNNYTLHQIFTEFKKMKGEKIIIDEKSLIDGIKQKAEDEGEWRY